MHYRTLGSSGLRVSIISLGAWQLGDTEFWGSDAQADGRATVNAALDAGINFFDTAEMYGSGRSEELLGDYLAGRRDEAIVATKVGPQNCSPVDVRAACERSLRRLKIEAIDLYQIHWPNHSIPFEDTYSACVRLRDEGKIRHIGVSNFGPIDLETWMNGGGCVSNQIGYNLLFRAPEYEILPKCRGRNVGVLAYMPLMQGILAGRWEKVDDIPMMRRRTRHFSCERSGTRHGLPGFEQLTMEVVAQLRVLAADLGQTPATLATAWLLAQPGISSVIVGARKPEQLERNVEAVSIQLSTDIVEKLDAISRPLKEALGNNADMWLGDSESRIR